MNTKANRSKTWVTISATGNIKEMHNASFQALMTENDVAVTRQELELIRLFDGDLSNVWNVVKSIEQKISIVRSNSGNLSVDDNSNITKSRNEELIEALDKTTKIAWTLFSKVPYGENPYAIGYVEIALGNNALLIKLKGE